MSEGHEKVQECKQKISDLEAEAAGLVEEIARLEGQMATLERRRVTIVGMRGLLWDARRRLVVAEQFLADSDRVQVEAVGRTSSYVIESAGAKRVKLRRIGETHVFWIERGLARSGSFDVKGGPVALEAAIAEFNGKKGKP